MKYTRSGKKGEKRMKFAEYELEKDWKEKIDYTELKIGIITSAIKEYKQVIARGERKNINGEWSAEMLERYINEEIAPTAGAKKGELQKKYIMQKIAEIAETLKEKEKGRKIKNLVEYITEYHKEWE